MEEEKSKYCPHCGTMIPFEDVYCPLCGKPQPLMPGMRKPIQKKNPWIALILSLLITGLGQLYLRHYSRAAIFFGATVLTGAVLSFYLPYENIMVFGVIMALISAWDAFHQAKKNQ